jgi:hypothetical protein
VYKTFLNLTEFLKKKKRVYKLGTKSSMRQRLGNNILIGCTDMKAIKPKWKECSWWKESNPISKFN